ncbi:MAG: TnpV protein [Lachnospiraceae bacterium]|nr:TnpV protein [Lachnospiraceae bacterium]
MCRKYFTQRDRASEKESIDSIQQMAEAQGITETPKAGNQMVWMGQMNNIRSAAVEIINKEFIYR